MIAGICALVGVTKWVRAMFQMGNRSWGQLAIE
jgi:hypothetical protein